MKTFETDIGFGYNEHNVFMDNMLNLSLPDVLHYDWPHCYFINGIFNREMDAFMELMTPRGYGPRTLHAYLAAWKWPKAYASGALVCVKNSVGGSMSEVLSSVLVIRKFVLDIIVPTGIYKKAVASMLCLLHVLDMLLHAQRGILDVGDLEKKIMQHLTAQQAAYGTSIWIPKCHFTLHLGKWYELFGFLLNTLVLERRHKVVKAAIKNKENTISFERNSLEEMVVQHLHDLSMMPSVQSFGLWKQQPPTNKMLEVLSACGLDVTQPNDIYTSMDAIIACRHVMAGDVVIFAAGIDAVSVGKVYFHYSVQDTCYTCMAPWRFVAANDTEVSYEVLDNIRLCPLAHLKDSIIYSIAGVGQISHCLLSVAHSHFVFK